MVTLAAMRDALADEWKRRSPKTPQEIGAFYRDSEHLAADLEAWHATPERQEWTEAIVKVAQANGVKSVLDVGAGGGHDLAALRGALPDITLTALEPNSTLIAEMWKRVTPPLTTTVDMHRVEEQFDLVLCIDVLEHVPEPETLLAQVMERVKPDGLLIEATATHDQATPLHLPELVGWEPTPTLQKAGFVPVEQFGRMVVWQKQGLAATVLVVAHREVSVPTVECLFELVGAGWPIAMVYGDADVGRARSKAASAWYLKNETDVFLMIDDDIVFRPEHAARVVALAREKRSIACAAYPVGDGGHLASRSWPGTLLEFGEGHGVEKIRWPATGFMAVHRDVIAALVDTLPLCYPDQPDRFWPLFQEFVFETNYLSEDYAFGQRAMDLGFDTWQDQEVILFHLKIKALSVLNMPGATVRQRDEV